MGAKNCVVGGGGGREDPTMGREERAYHVHY